jgi:four helix bundle protein
MARIEKFEDIDAWRASRDVTKLIYRITLEEPFCRDFALCNQIRRASVSVLSNIAEGFERGGNKEFIQFLTIAKGSCGEVRAQLYVALDQRYIDDETFELISGKLIETSRMLAGFIRYLQQSELRGPKFSKL